MCEREAQQLANYGSLSHQSMAYDLVPNSCVKKIISNDVHRLKNSEPEPEPEPEPSEPRLKKV
jgi:hypothetical protein